MKQEKSSMSATSGSTTEAQYKICPYFSSSSVNSSDSMWIGAVGCLFRLTSLSPFLLIFVVVFFTFRDQEHLLNGFEIHSLLLVSPAKPLEIAMKQRFPSVATLISNLLFLNASVFFVVFASWISDGRVLSWIVGFRQRRATRGPRSRPGCEG
jgi:hypothetical protein